MTGACVCVCVYVDFSDVKCSYFKSFCFSHFVVRDLLMSRLGHSSILGQNLKLGCVSNENQHLDFWRPSRRKKGNFSVHPPVLAFLCSDSVLFLPSLFVFRSQSPCFWSCGAPFIPFFPRFHLYRSISLFLSFLIVILQHTHSLPPFFSSSLSSLGACGPCCA